MSIAARPPYYFRIDEIHETDEGVMNTDNRSHWVPSIDIKGHALGQAGPSGQWWLCDGQNIHAVPMPVTGYVHYQTTTMYYNAGFGFWLSRGDATQTAPNWYSLSFENSTVDYSSYITNAGTSSHLACMRTDQAWPKVLFPDVYHGAETPYPQYGGLRGDISILWALIAFSLKPAQVLEHIPKMFRNGVWKTHRNRHVRTHQRGVIVWVYTCPGHDPATLQQYERGDYGKYYD